MNQDLEERRNYFRANDGSLCFLRLAWLFSIIKIVPSFVSFYFITARINSIFLCSWLWPKNCHITSLYSHISRHSLLLHICFSFRLCVIFSCRWTKQTYKFWLFFYSWIMRTRPLITTPALCTHFQISYFSLPHLHSSRSRAICHKYEHWTTIQTWMDVNMNGADSQRFALSLLQQIQTRRWWKILTSSLLCALDVLRNICTSNTHAPMTKFTHKHLSSRWERARERGDCGERRNVVIRTN